MLSSCRLQVFTLLHLVLGVTLHVLVSALLVERLRLEEVAHRTGSGRVVLVLEAQILGGLFDGLSGDVYLFVGIGQVVPAFAHLDDKHLALVF